MAGIGFELKKLFRRKGLFASLRAYGYAGIICTGPMLLGVLLQLGILLLCSWAGAPRDQQDLLVCMITYTLLFSLTVTSFFSMPVTRYLADMLYEEQEQTILPSFWGSGSMMLVLGCTLYGLFLLVSGATLLQGLLCLWLFAEMIVNWNAMSYLTAIKDYRGMVTLAISTNVVISLGMVGALSIVRFRTAVKDPLDLLYLFWSITTGITAGAGMYALGLVTAAVMIVMIYLFSHWQAKGRVYIAVIHYVGTEAGDDIVRALGRIKYAVKSKTMRGENTEMAVEVFCKDPNMEFADRIRAVKGVQDVTLIQYNGEYHG